MLENKEIRELIPHRYPFLLVDRILEMETGKKVVGIKNVSANEPFFQGHFPNLPIMPGVLIIEALAQASGICVASMDENKGKLGLFTSVDKMKFKKQVTPGDTLKLEGEVVQYRRGIAKVEVQATVDGEVAAKGVIKFALVDKESIE